MRVNYPRLNYEVLDVEMAKRICDVRNEDNYYLVVTNQGTVGLSDMTDDIEKNDFVMTEDFTNVDYDVASIVYYEALMNGVPVVIDGAPVPNALASA